MTTIPGIALSSITFGNRICASRNWIRNGSASQRTRSRKPLTQQRRRNRLSDREAFSLSRSVARDRYPAIPSRDIRYFVAWQNLPEGMYPSLPLRDKQKGLDRQFFLLPFRREDLRLFRELNHQLFNHHLLAWSIR